MLPLAETVIRTNLKTDMIRIAKPMKKKFTGVSSRSARTSSTGPNRSETTGPIDIAIEKQRQINELGYSTTELMSVVAVNEGNDWYISPLMTGADFGFRSTSRCSFLGR